MTENEFVSGVRVREGALVDAQQVEVTSEMILVALRAAVGWDGRVVALPGGDSRAQSFVTPQTPIRRDPTLAELVTVRAVAYAFELRMRLGELSR
jgi:hypothetical protein